MDQAALAVQVGLPDAALEVKEVPAAVGKPCLGQFKSCAVPASEAIRACFIGAPAYSSAVFVGSMAFRVARVSASSMRLSWRQRRMRGKRHGDAGLVAGGALDGLESQLEDQLRLDAAHRAEALDGVAPHKGIDLRISSSVSPE